MRRTGQPVALLCALLLVASACGDEETAIALDCRPETVKSQTLRALDKLREHPSLAELSEVVGTR